VTTQKTKGNEVNRGLKMSAIMTGNNTGNQPKSLWQKQSPTMQ
jgi:hypothetical protein